ncbi:MAG: cyclodeaminase [Firmicutes bacterium]|uniref:Ornithine cyclodeaminase n=1 Tax=Melghirimyces thermohalophilus TaxID=1236220 RepID=A0A1G6MYD5_9BACL|nr:cyclodeaminase [Melghirimyces thermohalophilus]MDA8351671.1 cyclodeaminase [Bacillota bacterium]SDC60569.1 ornithine cyclodeaminase [Melghirimyces thermohalophilus]
MWVFTEEEIRDAVALNVATVDGVEKGFSALVEGRVRMPPILRVDIPEHRGEVDVKTAVVEGEPFFAVKMSSGFFDNPKRGLASGSGLMVLLDVETGLPEAILLDNGLLTDLRTAAAGAVAARHLARDQMTTAGVIGAGSQARYQIRSLALVRRFDRILVWSRNKQRAEACAQELAAEIGVPAEVAPDTETVVKRSDVVITSTPATRPLIQKEWLHEGLHLTAMGSDAEHKQEIEGAAIAAVDRFVCDSRQQSLRLGELRAAVAEGWIDERESITELGEITASCTPGRRSEEEITLCDLTGTGVQDTVIAVMAYRRLREQGKGTRI